MKINKEMFFRKMFDDLSLIMDFCDANLENGWHGKELFQIHQLLFKEMEKCYLAKEKIQELKAG